MDDDLLDGNLSENGSETGRENPPEALAAAREVIGWGENRLADIFARNPILLENLQLENTIQQELDDEAAALVMDMAVDHVDADDDHALLDEGHRDEPLVLEDERYDRCYCERCPILGGEEEACCEHVGDRCLSLRVALSIVLAAENEPEIVAKRVAEARKLSAEWEEEVTADRTQRHHAYKKVERWYIEEMAPPIRHKLPNCVEQRIRDTWPIPTGVYTAYKRKPKKGGRGGRGKKKAGEAGHRQAPAKRGRRTAPVVF